MDVDGRSGRNRCTRSDDERKHQIQGLYEYHTVYTMHRKWRYRNVLYCCTSPQQLLLPNRDSQKGANLEWFCKVFLASNSNLGLEHSVTYVEDPGPSWVLMDGLNYWIKFHEYKLLNFVCVAKRASNQSSKCQVPDYFQTSLLLVGVSLSLALCRFSMMGICSFSEVPWQTVSEAMLLQDIIFGRKLLASDLTRLGWSCLFAEMLATHGNVTSRWGIQIASSQSLGDRYWRWQSERSWEATEDIEAMRQGIAVSLACETHMEIVRNFSAWRVMDDHSRSQRETYFDETPNSYGISPLNRQNIHKTRSWYRVNSLGKAVHNSSYVSSCDNQVSSKYEPAINPTHRRSILRQKTLPQRMSQQKLSESLDIPVYTFTRAVIRQAGRHV